MAATGCGLFDGEGPIRVQTKAFGSIFEQNVERKTPVEPGTVFTLEVCELNNHTAEPLENDESFSSDEFDKYPSELKFHVPQGGFCRLEFSVGPPDGPVFTKLLEVDVPD